MMEAERIEKYIETGIIEVAPLAYMRGRPLMTLSLSLMKRRIALLNR